MIRTILKHLKNSWLYMVEALGVFAATTAVRLGLESISGVRWWVAVIFCYGVWFSVLYENAIRVRLRLGHRKRMILLEILLVWTGPLIMGYAFAQYLLVTAYSN
jgi:hypothetical protein